MRRNCRFLVAVLLGMTKQSRKCVDPSLGVVHKRTTPLPQDDKGKRLVSR